MSLVFPYRAAAFILILALGCAGATHDRMSRAIRIHAMGDVDVAVEQARAAVDLEPGDVEAHWIYQDLLIASGRHGAAGEEYFHRLRRSHDDPDLRLLHGRLIGEIPHPRDTDWAHLALAEVALRSGDPQKARRWIEKGIPSSPVATGIALEIEVAARDFPAARDLAEEYLSDGGEDLPPSAAAIYAHLLLDDPRKATAIGRRVHETDPRQEIHKALGIAHLRARSFRGALQSFRRAGPVPDDLLQVAFGGTIWSLIEGGRPEEVRPIAEEAVRRFPRSGRLLGLQALILGDIEMMSRAVDLSPESSDLVRQARLFLIDRGRPVEAYRVWTRSIPEGIDVAEENRLSPRFAEVRKWSDAFGEDPADGDAAIALAEAYGRVGWLPESVVQFGKSMMLDVDPERIRKGLGNVLSFWTALRRLQAYLEGVEEGSLDMDDLLDIVRQVLEKEMRVSLPHEDLVESRALFGKESNPFVRPDSALHQVFLRYNHVMDVREVGDLLECRISDLVGWRDEEEEIRGETYRWARLTTDRCAVQYPSGTARGVAGQASWSGGGFTVKVDAIRNMVLDRDGAGDLRDRLLRGAMERAGSFPALLAREADNVAQHELGHIVDFSDLIPWGYHIPRHVGILLSALFGSHTVSGRYQAVAEAFALARAEDPHLALVGSLDWIRSEMSLVTGGEPPTRRPYRETARFLLDGIVEAVREDPGSYPEVDVDRDIVDQIDKIPAESIRAIAWELFERMK